MRILLLTLCLSAALAPWAGAAAPTAEPVVKPRVAADVAAPRPDYFQFQHMHEIFIDRGRIAPVGLLFLGDSITEAWWNVPEFWWQRYGAYQPANFGISGDRIQNVIWRLEHGELDRIAPGVIVLHIGTNNTADHSAPEIVAGIDRILALVRTKLPATKVLLLAIFPRGPEKKPDGTPGAAALRMAVIREVNALLSARDDGSRVRFLDIGHVFLDAQGDIPQALMPDQLHLSPAAYEKWADAIQPLLDEMLQVTPKKTRP